MSRSSAVILSLFLCTGAGSAAAATDDAAVAQLYADYAAAWLANDPGSTPAAILALFTDDATLLPHHGDPMVTPKKAIAEHWFPGMQLFGTVDRFETDVRRVETSGDLGYLYARFDMAFSFNGESRQSAGNHLLVARRGADGWRIAALIWNDPPPNDD